MSEQLGEKNYPQALDALLVETEVVCITLRASLDFVPFRLEVVARELSGKRHYSWTVTDIEDLEGVELCGRGQQTPREAY